MKKIMIGVTALLLLGLAMACAGQVVVHRTSPTVSSTNGPFHFNPALLDGRPRTLQELTTARRRIAESYRYQGPEATAHPGFDPDDRRVKQICELLRQMDFIPEQRVQRFASLDRNQYALVSWHLAVEGLDIRTDRSIIRVRVSPRLKAIDGGAVTCSDSYLEDYVLVGGKLQYLGGEPLPKNGTLRNRHEITSRIRPLRQ